MQYKLYKDITKTFDLQNYLQVISSNRLEYEMNNMLAYRQIEEIKRYESEIWKLRRIIE